jgi:protein gp37
MADKTGIEWTQSDDGTPGATWNPVTGCTKVSAGCDHCYAETFAERWRGVPGHHFERGFDVQMRPERLDQPHHWKRPRRIFVNSVSDLFHKDIPDEYIARVWQVMASTPRHTYLILTKRHARMRSWVSRCATSPNGWITHNGSDPDACGGSGVIVGYPEPTYRRPDSYTGPRGGKPRYKPTPPAYGWPLPNVHLGVSVEDPHWADLRIPALLKTPAAVRFISAEPLLGPVTLFPGRWIPPIGGGPRADLSRPWETPGPVLDWVIVGGESGPGARPMAEGWARNLVGECTASGTPVFVKQLGSVLGKELGAGSKGGDWDTWPADLKIRQFPGVTEMTGAA